MYKLTTGGLGFVRRGLGDLPGFPGADPVTLLGNIGGAIGNVLGNLLYVMGAVPESDMSRGQRADGDHISQYFLSLVSPADVTAGNYAKINSAANAAALHFLKMFGGQPRGATGVAPSDLVGVCMAYNVGPSEFYAAQTRTYGNWSAATKCAQLKALMSGSGLNWLQVAAGGDGLGNMPTGSSVSQADMDRAASAAQQAAIDSAWAAQQAAGAMVPTGSAVQPGVPLSPYAAGQNNVIAGPNGPVWVGGGSAQLQTSRDPIAAPVVQTYQPMPISQPVQQAGFLQSLLAPFTKSAPSPSVAPSTGSTLAMVPPASPGLPVNVQYPANAPQSAASPAVTSGSSPLGGITDWISSNPLLAAGLAAGALFMFSKGGRR